MKVIYLVNYKKTYLGKDGNTYPSTNFYIEFDNGHKIAIKNLYPNDYQVLKYLAIKEEIK